ncbi:MAG TPA: hypothetical protein VL463_07805 [Kofleriaceae bacterium]|jgi:hypothetical protein|nr:hypothetical protein [Kofleriaceae bacterium]
MRASAIVVILAACGGSKSQTPDAKASAIDAPASVIDAPVASIDASVTAAHVVYLAFEGETIKPGNESVANDTTPLVTTQYTPKYLPNDSQRATKIAGIVGEVQAILAPYDVAVVTTRPSSGNFDLIAFGGTSTDAGLQQGIGALALAGQCSLTGEHIALVFDLGWNQHDAARFAVSLFGMSHDVSMSTVAADCMCFAAGTCTTLSAACTIGGAGTTVDTTYYNCAGAATFDENAAFVAAFGAAK